MSTPTIWYYGDQKITGNYTQNQNFTLAGSPYNTSNITATTTTSNIGTPAVPWYTVYTNSANVSVLNVMSFPVFFANTIGPPLNLLGLIWGELAFNSPTIYDWSGNRNIGPLGGAWGGSIQTTGGPNGGQRISFTSSSFKTFTINSGLSNPTFSFWVRVVNRTAANGSNIIEIPYKYNTKSFTFSIGISAAVFTINFLGIAAAQPSGVSVVNNTWYNIVIIFGVSSVNIYFNGIINPNKLDIVAGTRIEIGTQVSIPGPTALPGTTVDYADLRVYNTSLSSDQASTIYTSNSTPTLQGTANVIGNVYTSNSITAGSINATSMNVGTLSLVSYAKNLGIGTTVAPPSTLFVGGNLFASNALTTQNIWVTNINTSSLNSMTTIATTATTPGNAIFTNALTVANIFTTSLNIGSNVNTQNITSVKLFSNIVTSSFNTSSLVSATLSIGTYDPFTTLNVLGNVFVSNAVTTANIYANYITVSGISNIGFIYGVQGIGDQNGNIFVSNSITTTNLFPTGIYIKTININSLIITSPLQSFFPSTFFSFQFTTMGAYGAYGPTSVTYPDLPPGDFTLQNGIQYWTVPSSGTYSFVVAGAGQYFNNPVYGVVLNVTWTLAAGTILAILVGQNGTRVQDGNGGTFVAIVPSVGSLSSAIPLVVAGGAGGWSVDSETVTANGTLSTTGQNSGPPGTGAPPGITALGGVGPNGAAGVCPKSSLSVAESGAGFNVNGTLCATVSGSFASAVPKAFTNGGTGDIVYENNGFVGGFGGGGVAATAGEAGGGGGGGYGGGGGGNPFASGGGGGSYDISGFYSGAATNDGQGYVIITNIGYTNAYVSNSLTAQSIIGYGSGSQVKSLNTASITSGTVGFPNVTCVNVYTLNVSSTYANISGSLNVASASMTRINVSSNAVINSLNVSGSFGTGNVFSSGLFSVGGALRTQTLAVGAASPLGANLYVQGNVFIIDSIGVPIVPSGLVAELAFNTPTISDWSGQGNISPTGGSWGGTVVPGPGSLYAYNAIASLRVQNQNSSTFTFPSIDVVSTGFTLSFWLNFNSSSSASRQNIITLDGSSQLQAYGNNSDGYFELDYLGYKVILAAPFSAILGDNFPGFITVEPLGGTTTTLIVTFAALPQPGSAPITYGQNYINIRVPAFLNSLTLSCPNDGSAATYADVRIYNRALTLAECTAIGIAAASPSPISYISGQPANLSVNNVYVSGTLNASSINTFTGISTSNVGIGTVPQTTNLYVQGNVYISNTLTAQTIYYGEDITKRGPYLAPSTVNSPTIQAWISATCNASSQPVRSWWATSATPAFGNVITGASGFQGGVLIPGGKIVLVPGTNSNVGLYTPKTLQFSNLIIPPPSESFSGGVLSPTGNVIFCPQTSNVGVFNPLSNAFSNGAALPGGQYSGVLTSNGVIFAPNGVPSNIINFNYTSGVASNVLALPSPNNYGKSWTSTSSIDTGTQWRVCAWSPQLGIFVAVGRGGTNRSAWSIDGKTWTSTSSIDTGTHWYGCAWSAQLGIFVAVGDIGTNRSAWSIDGKTWTSTNSIDTGTQWLACAWSPQLGIFVAVGAVGTNRSAWSIDGKTWTSTSSIDTGTQWRACAWSAQLGIFVAVGSAGTYRSAWSIDGKTWTSTNSIDSTGFWDACAWSPQLGIFVAVGSVGTYRSAWSIDGKSWTSTSELGGISGTFWNGCAWSAQSGIFVAVAGIDGTQKSAWSVDGKTWTLSSSIDYRTDWYGCAWSPQLGIFVAVGGGIYNPSAWSAGPCLQQGACLLTNGNVIAPSPGTSNVIQFDPVRLVASNITVGTDGFSSLTLVPNGNVIGVPQNSNIIVINPSTFVSSNVKTNVTLFSAGCLMPSGNLVFAPSLTSNVGLFDPGTLTFSNSTTTGGAFTSATLVQSGQVIFGGANVGIYDTMTPVSTEFCMSPYFNKF